MNGKRVCKAAVWSVILIGYYFFTRYTGLGIPCIFRALFHLQCPGCGVTHMVLALAEGRFRKAFLSNPVIFCFLPFLTYETARLLKGYLYEKDVLFTSKECFLWYILGTALVVLGILRNLPFFS